jgi:Putative adhesin
MASEYTTFPVSEPIKLVARLGPGRLEIAARDNLAHAAVRLTPHHPQSDVLDHVVVEMRGSTLVISGPRQSGWTDVIGGWRRGRELVDTLIEVPSETPLKLSSSGDEITLTGCGGDTDIATSATRITLEAVAGRLRLRYGHGDSRVDRVTGSVQLDAGRGRAHLGEVRGSLHARFGSGDLHADVVHGDLQVRAGAGSAQLGAVHGNVDLAFGSGPVEIGLPAGVAAQVDLTSGTGEVHTDLPVEPVPAPAERTITVRVRTGSGPVSLLRAVAA